MKTKFSDMCGNATTLALLKRLLRFNNFKPVTIFHGLRGTGKSASALICAQALTCEQPTEDGACGNCQSCRINLKALGDGTQSPYVKIVNMGRINKTDDVNDLIHEVFGFQSSAHSQVYVFEEIHALKYVKNGFVALLTEIDRMTPDTYIIATTTALYDIKEDLLSRALLFEFKQLKRNESLLFAEHLLAEKKKTINKETLKLVISYCKGIPREIEKLIGFVTENNVSLDEIRDFLQILSMSTIVNLFNLLQHENFAEALELLRNLEETISVPQIIKIIKDFIVDAVFFLETGSSQEFNKEEKEVVREIFSDNMKVAKLVACLEKLNNQSGEADLVLAMLKIRMILCGKNETAIVAAKQSMAAQERITAERTRAGMLSGTGNFKGLKKLTASSLAVFGDDNVV